MSNFLKTKTTENEGILTSAGTALDPNEARVSYIIQNLGTNPLFVKEGSGASTTDFTYILPANTAQDDGSSPPKETVAYQCYTGIVTIAGTTPRFIASEREEN